MTTRQHSRSLAVLTVALLVVSACSRGPSGDDASAGTTAVPTTTQQDEIGGIPVDNQSDLVLGLSVQNLERTFFQGLDRGATLEAEELGVELVVLEAGDDAAKQANDVDALVAKGVDGILLSPVDSAEVVALADKVKAAGIPLLAVANQIGSIEQFGEQHVYDGTVALVTNDDIDMGSKAADIVAGAVGDQDTKIAILEGAVGASNTELRRSGFSDRLDERDVNYEVVATDQGDWNPQNGGEACMRIFESTTDVDVLFSMSDAMTSGCVEVLSPEQRASIKIVSIGGNEQGIALLQEGAILGTVCQKPATMGALAVETLVIAIRTGQVDQGLTFYQTPQVTINSAASCTPQW